MENNTPQFTTLLLSNQEKALIGAFLRELSDSQQFAFGTIFKAAEERAKGMIGDTAKVPEA